MRPTDKKCIERKVFMLSSFFEGQLICNDESDPRLCRIWMRRPIIREWAVLPLLQSWSALGKNQGVDLPVKSVNKPTVDGGIFILQHENALLFLHNGSS